MDSQKSVEPRRTTHGQRESKTRRIKWRCAIYKRGKKRGSRNKLVWQARTGNEQIQGASCTKVNQLNPPSCLVQHNVCRLHVLSNQNSNNQPTNSNSSTHENRTRSCKQSDSIATKRAKNACEQVRSRTRQEQAGDRTRQRGSVRLSRKLTNLPDCTSLFRQETESQPEFAECNWWFATKDARGDCVGQAR